MIGTALALLAQAAAPEALKADGAWRLDGGRCTLSRAFRSPAGAVTLGFQPNIGTPGGELVLVLPGRASGRYEVNEGRVVLGEDGASYPAVWSRVGRRDQPFNGVTIQPADGFWGALPQARLLTADVGKRERMRFDLGPMAAATAALEKCRDERAALTRTARRR